MSEHEAAKLYTVSEPLDRPVEELIAGENAVDIQFNPSSLKVSLANSLKEEERSGNSRAAQYIDKSSSSLTVELIFDTSDRYVVGETDEDGEQQPDKRVDVRRQTGAIANTFMLPQEGSSERLAPKRCLFAWGTFAFVGIMESFDETLDFFAPEGTPLRATVALKLTESRFQFRTEEAKAAERDTPTLGNGADSVSQANPGKSDKSGKNWRKIALFNGEESPLALSAELQFIPGSAPLGDKAGTNLTPPGFSFGASASLGTNIPGAFSADSQSGGGLSAGSIVSGGAQLREGGSGGASASLSPKVPTDVGFD